MALRRKAVAQAAQPRMQVKPFIAPNGGWVSATNLAAAPTGSAQVLENFYPTSTGIKMRSGSSKHATASTTDPLESAMSYSGAVPKMFGVADGEIFDLTSVVDEDVPPSASVTGLTSSYFSAVNFTTAGGQFLIAANGSDAMQKYDGSSWASIVTGGGAGEISGVDTTTVNHINIYRNRLWLSPAGSTSVFYLPTDAIAGTVGELALAGVFQRGGSVLFTATWSLDAGDGLDDKLVVVSTTGEVAVYQGDPADADFSLVGRYEAAPPMGKNAFLRIGGDLLILTTIGIIPMSAIQAKDPAALGLAAITRKIQPDWEAEARERVSLPWEIVKWTSRNIAYVTCPVTSAETVTPPICFAVNLETGAFCKITGWNTRCFVLHGDQVYFGTNDGALMQADINGSDDGAPIYYRMAYHMDHLGAIGRQKTVLQARGIFRTKAEFNAKISVSTDYELSFPAYPDAATPSASPGEWDVGLWDVAAWDTGLNYYTVQTRWVSIGKTGFSHAPQLQIVSGTDAAPSAEMVAMDLTYIPAGYAV